MRTLLLASLVFVLPACGSSGTGDDHAADPTLAAPVAFAPAKHAVRCGCAIESIGLCGSYVDIDGSFVELEFPADQDHGEMPFCGKEGLVAEVGGELHGDRFVASSFELE